MNIKNAKIIVASGPVIIEKREGVEKVLLNRHGEDEKAKQYWKFVGGRIEDFDFADETQSLEEACRREVKEEMGIGIKIITPLKPMMISHPDEDNTFVVLIHYLAKRIGEVNCGSDIEQWQWFDINKLPDHCAPNIKPVIDEYIKLKENLKFEI